MGQSWAFRVVFSGAPPHPMAQFDAFISAAQPAKPGKLSSLKGKVCVVGGELHATERSKHVKPTIEPHRRIAAT